MQHRWKTIVLHFSEENVTGSWVDGIHLMLEDWISIEFTVWAFKFYICEHTLIYSKIDRDKNWLRQTKSKETFRN